MQVFKTFFKISKKQIASSVIYLGIFLLLVNIISNLKSNETVDYADKKCKIVVYDYDNSEESVRLKNYLESVHIVKDIKDDDEDILDSLYLQNVDYVLYIEEGYSETGKLTNIKRPGSVEGMYVDNQIENYEASIEALMAAGYDIDEAYDKTIEAYDTDELVNMAENKSENKPIYYYIFLYIPYAGTMVMFQILALVLVSLNKKEVSDRTTVSSISIRNRNAQVAFASIVLSTIVWFMFIIFAFFYDGADILSGKNPLNLLNAFIYIILVAGIVFIVGNFNVKNQAVSMVANIYGLGSCFLGGIFVPLDFFGEGMLRVSRFMPTYWYVQAEEAIVANEEVSTILKYMGVEVLFAVVFFAIAMVVSKRMKLERQA